MSEKKQFDDLDKPQYNSTLKLIKRLDDLQLSNNKAQFHLSDEEIERIHEKVCKY